MNKKTVITHYCIIRDQSIIRDGKVLFTAKGSSLNEFLLDAYTFLKVDYPKFYKMDNLSKLGFLAAEVLLKDRTLVNDYAAESVAVVLSNAHSSQDTDMRYAASARTMASPALFVYTLPNIVAGEICIRHKIKGENAFFIAPAFDPELMADYTAMVLSPDAGTGACIGGWVDVLGEHHDVFLYLQEKNKPGLLEHTAGQLKELYNTTLWNS
jgi:hypothetical protein